MKGHLALLIIAAVAACRGDEARPRGVAHAVLDAPLLERAKSTAVPARMPAATVVLETTAGQAPAPLPPITPATASDAAMLVRSGQMSIEVRDVDSAMASVRAAAARVGGYVTDVDVTAGRNETPSATLTAKVPGPRYDDLLRQLQAIGTVESAQTDVEDVGEEYVDVSALLNNDRRLEQRLIDLLARRTGKLEDVLAVERELARVRGESDRYEARLRYLTSHAAMSTIVATVHTRLPLVAESGARSPLALAFTQARRNFVESVAWVIAALGYVVSIGALALVGLVAFRYTRGRLRPA